MNQPKFNPEVATTIERQKERQRKIQLVWIGVLLVGLGAGATALYYEYTYRYENCIVRNVAGTSDLGVRLLMQTCRDLSE